LLIISPWLRNGVLDEAFLESLEGLLKDGVDIFLGWGISGPGGERSDSDWRAYAALSQLASRYTKFRFRYLGNTHAKVLLSDRRFVIVTSFNWLSYRGDPDRTFRDERGVLVAVAEEIDRQFETLQERFV
jgi:phosphatidylserine/phosphatidylglycerophosphate/cardiolipin synthase-like enzyme